MTHDDAGRLPDRSPDRLHDDPPASDPDAADAPIAGSPADPPRAADGPRRHDDDGYARYGETELALVLSRWDLGSLSLIEPWRRGSRRSPKVRVEAGRGTYLLKRHPGGLEADRITFTHEVVRHLDDRGAAVPAMIPDRTGSTIVDEPPFAYELQAFIPGRPSRAGESAAAAAGHALGRLHAALVDAAPLAPPTVRSFHHQQAAVRAALERVPQRIAEAAAARTDDRGSIDLEDLGRACRWLRRAYRDAATRADAAGFDRLPSQVIHGDLHPGNVLLDPHSGDVLGIVDFDASRIEPRIVDVANAALQYAMERTDDRDPALWPGRLSAPTIRAFLKGYDATADLPLSTEERACLPWLMFEALVVETTAVLARTGDFGDLPGGAFLLMVERKARWIRERSTRLLEWLERPAHQTRGEMDG